MDYIVDTQLELCNTSWLHSLEILVLYTWYRQPSFQVSLDGSQVQGLKGQSVVYEAV